MTREHMIWLETAKIQTKPIKPITIYIASYENKEVRVYFIDSEICINWYVDGRLIEKPRFPKESVDEIYKFMESLHYKYICENLMYKILHTVEKYLPYLEDGENPIGSLKNIKIVGEIKLE